MNKLPVWAFLIFANIVFCPQIWAAHISPEITGNYIPETPAGTPQNNNNNVVVQDPALPSGFDDTPLSTATVVASMPDVPASGGLTRAEHNHVITLQTEMTLEQTASSGSFSNPKQSIPMAGLRGDAPVRRDIPGIKDTRELPKVDLKLPEKEKTKTDAEMTGSKIWLKQFKGKVDEVRKKLEEDTVKKDIEALRFQKQDLEKNKEEDQVVPSTGILVDSEGKTHSYEVIQSVFVKKDYLMNRSENISNPFFRLMDSGSDEDLHNQLQLQKQIDLMNEKAKSHEEFQILYQGKIFKNGFALPPYLMKTGLFQLIKFKK